MIHFYTRIASFLLAFGFFISCSTLQSSNHSNDAPDELPQQQLSGQITLLEQKIDSSPDNPDLHFQKGKLLTKLAQKYDDPSDRSSHYLEARHALTKASALYGDSNKSGYEKVNDQLNITWSIEHNQGIKLMQAESAGKPDYNKAAAHFDNATLIIPDSAISYTMEARSLYKDQQQQKAIETLEDARKKISNPPVLLLEQLAFLYLENDKPQKAVAVYEQAESFSDQNLNLLHGLSNAYINAGNHDKAIRLLTQLITNEPENIIYGQSLATEYYFLAKKEMDSVINKLANKDADLEDTKFSIADSLLKQAEKQFIRINQGNSGNKELTERFAKFYLNSASKYQQLLPYLRSNNKKEIESQITQFLSSSIPLLETLTEQNSGDSEIWRHLYRAYSILGMEREAKSAKANF